jgi:hypothetical protein
MGSPPTQSKRHPTRDPAWRICAAVLASASRETRPRNARGIRAFNPHRNSVHDLRGNETMGTATRNPAKESLRKEQAEQRHAAKHGSKDAELNRALKDTFPASDPIAAESATKSVARKRAAH